MAGVLFLQTKEYNERITHGKDLLFPERLREFGKEEKGIDFLDAIL